MKVLIISTVWVEPNSSAAGSRMLQLINVFQDISWEVTYSSTASNSEYAFDLSTLGVKTAEIQVNEDSFDAFAKAYQPNIVLFDRFMAEEQFGWRIAETCPKALKILDTEDLHYLRKARETAHKQNRPFQQKDLLSDVAKREIASIYRCDLTLMISSYEMELLTSFFEVPKDLLMYIPFLLSPVKNDFPSFEERTHFISIGNFLHSPNLDATLHLKEIWPLIRQKLPNVEVHIYGAYGSDKVRQLHKPEEGFIYKGRAYDAQEVVTKARVLLAPIRFGAGLKGKFIDAMQCGTPSVTTPVGAEAMHNGLPWCGRIENDKIAFAQAAIEIYTSQDVWKKAQDNGVAIINKNFQKKDFDVKIVDMIETLIQNLDNHRLNNFTGQMLLHHTMRSTKFMSKWIEEKNRN